MNIPIHNSAAHRLHNRLHSSGLEDTYELSSTKEGPQSLNEVLLPFLFAFSFSFSICLSNVDFLLHFHFHVFNLSLISFPLLHPSPLQILSLSEKPLAFDTERPILLKKVTCKQQTRCRLSPLIQLRLDLQLLRTLRQIDFRLFETSIQNVDFSQKRNSNSSCIDPIAVSSRDELRFLTRTIQTNLKYDRTLIDHSAVQFLAS